MAERAHPADVNFKPWSLHFRLRRKLIPWVTLRANPYYAAFKWRYAWVNSTAKGRDILDIPCGMGWGTSLITEARRRVGIDIDESSIKEAIQKYGNRIEFLVSSMGRIPFDSATFDVVVCLEGIEHVPVDVGRAFLSEAHRVLRDGGRLFISSPCHPKKAHSGNPHHIHEYRPDELKAMLLPGFRIEFEKYRTVDALRVCYLECSRTPLDNSIPG